MNAIWLTLVWEIKTAWVRNSLFLLVIALLIFLGEFTDFPFSQDESEAMTEQGKYFIYLFSHLVLLAVFRGIILKDLDNREFFSQHPVDYKYHFLGKCLAVALLLLLGDLLTYLITFWSAHCYGNSLGTYPKTKEADFEQPMSMINDVFTSGLILVVALFRPFHYALLIVLLSAIYWVVTAHPEIKDQLPLFTEDYRKALLWMPMPTLLGMYLYEWQMTRSITPAKPKSLAQTQWYKNLYFHKAIPLLLTLVCLGMVIYQVYSDDEDKSLSAASEQLQQSVKQLKNQTSKTTQNFTFSFSKDNQWIYEQLIAFADEEWRHLQAEFGIKHYEDSKIDVFIKTSDEHTLGSTRGSFIIINADAINKTVNKQEAIRKTFRHELTHVIINRLSNYQFVENEDILNGFFHEGLAELAEGQWDKNNPALNSSAALHYVTYDEELTELLPKLRHFGEYDYDLSYSLGFVFWSEFLKIYGRDKIKAFLGQLAQEQDNDKNFAGIQYVFHKANSAKIDMFRLLQACKQKMLLTYASLDKQIINDTRLLKNFKVVLFGKGELLIPYEFSDRVKVFCKFRTKEAIQTRSEKLMPFKYLGKTGGLCRLPESGSEEIRLSLYFAEGIQFYTPWIEVPREKPVNL